MDADGMEMITKLVLHYAPGGILATLKTEPCPGRRTGGFGGIQHGCGCETAWTCTRCGWKLHIIYRIVNITLLTPDLENWYGDQCLLARHAEQLLMGQADG